MSECQACQQEMEDAVSCTFTRYSDFVDGVERDRIRYGSESHASLKRQYDAEGPGCGPGVMRWMLGPGAERDPTWNEVLEYLRPSGPCPDCRTPVAGFHHPGCDKEECPRCGGQALSCECVPMASAGDRNLPAAWGVSRAEALKRIGGAMSGDDVVGIMWKDEDEVDDVPIGPAWEKLADGAHRPLSGWMSKGDARKIADERGVPLEEV